jgi:hypothetical protein
LGDELIACNGDEGGELSNSNASCASRPLTQSPSVSSFWLCLLFYHWRQ